MEAQPNVAADRGGWRDAIDPRVEAELLDAVDALTEFPVLDATVLRLLALCDDADATTADLAGAIEQDPAFAANLLHYANSAAMARPIRAKSIRQAVMLVGRRALRRLSLEAATYRFLERAPGSGGAVRGQLHNHAIGVAAGAVAAAEAARMHGDAAHLAALLHDVGKLVLPLAYGEDVVDDIAAHHAAGPQRAALERARLGVDHAMAGALLAERWGCPPEVVEAIALHHGGPGGLHVASRETACVQIADAVAGLLMGAPIDPALLDLALEHLGLGRDALDELALQASVPLRTRPQAEFAGHVTRVADAVRTDDLTGLSTRRSWLADVEDRLEEGLEGSVVLVAVEGLAAVTRTRGYATANLLLAEVARVAARHGDAGRVSGVVLGLWIDADRGDAEIVGEHLVREAVSSLAEDGAPAVELSLAVSSVPQDGARAVELLAAAEARLPERDEPAGRRQAGRNVPLRSTSSALNVL